MVLLIEDFKPLFFADEEAIAIGHCLVDVLRPVLESYTKSGDFTFVAVADAEFFMLVDLEPNFDFALLNKGDFSEFIKLLVNFGASFVEDWLQSFQDCDHEISVVNIVPSIVISMEAEDLFNMHTLVLKFFFSPKDLKEICKIIDKVLENELCE